jgi:hypothetical protein
MRFEDLSARLVAVEAKLANLTGTTVNTNSATSIEELDARLSVVEVQVDQLISAKIQSQVEAIVAAPAADAPVAVEAVVALSASSDVPAAADIVADVVTAQVEAASVEHTEVAEIIAAAVMAVVEAAPVTETVASAVCVSVTGEVTPTPINIDVDFTVFAATVTVHVFAVDTGAVVTPAIAGVNLITYVPAFVGVNFTVSVFLIDAAAAAEICA